jgi:hypothetical protein
LTIAAIAGFCLLTGCGKGNNPGGSAGPGTTQTTGSQSVSQDKVIFAGDVCDAVGKFIQPAKSFRPDTSSPAAAVTSIRTQLSSLSTGLDDATKALGDVDTAAVPDGQKAVDDLQRTFSQMKEAIDRSKTKLDGVNPSDPQAAGAAIQEAGKDLASLGSLQNPLDQPALKSPDMQAAADQAPTCQDLKSMMTTESTPTS